MALSTQVKRALAKEIGDALAIEDVLDGILESVVEHTSPEDVFPEEALEAWAEQNGYVKAE